MSKRTVAAAAALCLAGYIVIQITGLASPTIRSDGFSYYVYLPSWFIYHDPALSAVADDCCGGTYPAFTAIIKWPGTGRWVNAHPIGVAVMQAPFFLIADALTRWSNLSRDGFTLYYQLGVGLSGVFWTIAGLSILRRLLLRDFSERVTTATLVSLLLGTNLFHYATFDGSYSHAYSFFLIAAFLDLTDHWHRAPSRRVSLGLGVVSGLIVLVRHTNALALLMFPLYGVVNRHTAAASVRKTFAHWQELAIVACVGLLVLAPQLAVYYQATGRALISSYGELGFNWTSPRIADVLVGVQKGLFFWSPLLVLASAGLLIPGEPARRFAAGGLAFLALHTYIIASWWDWQFGASYGHRGFVDTLPIFALGLAAAFDWSARRPTRLTLVFAFAAAAVTLSIGQMLQYWTGVIPFSDTTWDQYRDNFLRLR